MCWGWKRRTSTRTNYESHLYHGRIHFCFDRFVYFIHGVRSTAYSNNEDRLLDLRSKYSLTYCMISITVGYLIGIIGFIADDWVTMAAFQGNEKEHIPYTVEEPDVRLKKGLILAIDYFMVKDTMYGRLVDELGLLENKQKCYERYRVQKELKEIQVHWSLSRTYAVLTLFCCTWVIVIMLSSVLTKHWPAWHQKRGGRRLTAKMKHTKVEEEQIKSITSSTALNIGQSTFLSCYCFAMTSCQYNALMASLNEYGKKFEKMIVCVEYPGYNYYLACGSFMLMTVAFMSVVDAYDAA